MRENGIGQSLPRSEDLRLLRGLGRYTDDFRPTDQAALVVLRSPHAHARIVRIDTGAARAAPGVLAVLTGEDAAREGFGTFSSRVTRKRPDGRPNVVPPYRVLALERVRHVGDAVAAVVAETVAEAKDAAELIEVEYEALPSVTATADAAKPGAPVLWDDIPGNVVFVHDQGNQTGVDEAFARAAHVARFDFTVSRVTAAPMEPRSALGAWDPADQRYTLTAALQSPHQIRSELAERILKIPTHQLRVVAPDVGGGFGMKGSPFPELALVLWAARVVGRPVKWVSERSEGFASDHHARDNVSKAELALDKDGKFLALRVNVTANLGAYLAISGIHCPTNNLGGLAGVYTTPHIHVHVVGVVSNTNPTSAYRGAGRPEATYALERVIDVAARDLGIDPAELRRRNLIPASAMPYDTRFIFKYDSGDFVKNLDMALELGGWSGFEARRAEARRRGKLRGIGIANPIEIAGGPPDVPLEEGAEIRFDPAGGVTVLMGTHNHGQGHETTFRQIMVDLLGVPYDKIRLVCGDTDQVIHGKGTFGSRSMSSGGSALVRAAEKIVARGKRLAAHLLEAAEADIEFADGAFTVAGTDKAIDIVALAQASYRIAGLPRDLEVGLTEAAVVIPAGPTYPNGTHVCEVEVDPDTGAVEIVCYSVVDDVGVMVNPLIVKGQIHGGVAQGVGQVLFEQVAYEASSGQLLSGSFMDYSMPRADDLPSIAIASHEVPAKSNPLGVKGAGEAGTIGALPAAMSAIVDALRPLGVDHLDMPATPERVWRAIQGARRQAAE
ncbi:MAG TPA: xanthine dehydrogenase family protein molybdopterin-binding subunit [Candidatus Sulfotelmatobacter sp.]|nr:xanthine dehydrogenase family protein molybdopterin-binding subunit [Candidatus Sulfotelmatobacter sp.]